MPAAETNIISLGIYLFLVVAVVSVMLGTYFLGPRHNDRATGTPYESGILTTGSARLRFSAHFYLGSMFCVVFDLESVFLYAWASSVRELGVAGLIQVSIFVGILLIALFYLFRIGALNIGPKLRKPIQGNIT
jgi:NADH-quinone oxidoreductase subunit A